VLVRRARPDDWPAITRAFVDAGRAAWAEILGPDAAARLAPPERWKEAIDADDVLVVVVDDAVAGFAVLAPAELDAFYTHPAVWGRGAGRTLMRDVLAELARRGFEEATLWTAEENHRPRRIYESAGWRTDGAVRRRMLFGVEFAELRYRRSVA
jgi:GNAT superfamily N-acetyltransferase